MAFNKENLKIIGIDEIPLTAKRLIEYLTLVPDDAQILIDREDREDYISVPEISYIEKSNIVIINAKII